MPMVEIDCTDWNVDMERGRRYCLWIEFKVLYGKIMKGRMCTYCFLIYLCLRLMIMVSAIHENLEHVTSLDLRY